MRLALTQGAYSARSVIASAQRCVNLFPEKNPPDSPVPFTYYNVPGLTSLSAPPNGGAGRCLYWANSDALFGVVGGSVYYIGPDWSFTLLGTIGTTTGIVSMSDNGTTASLVDGSSQGWQIDLATHVMTQITEANNAPPATSTFAFYGANRTDMLDGFMLFNQPGTRNFYSTYTNEMVFDSLYFAAKNGFSDNLVTLIVTRREVWLLGERTTEIWFDSGDAGFPFQILPGPFIQHGCVAKASVAQIDGAVFWVSQDQGGTNIIARGEGYAAKPISTPAMENEMASYPTVADAEGFCFTMNGHTFYQVNFPSADKSWRWDERTPDQWHEAVWTDDNGAEHRHRASCAAYAYGRNVCLDWETGQLYAFDLDNHTDAGQPMQFRRGYPHTLSDGRQVVYPGFTLDVEAATSADTLNIPGPFPQLDGVAAGGASIDAGVPEDALLVGPAPPSAAVTTPVINLRWSDTRGRTWGNPVQQSLGSTGDYLSQPQWNRLGRARDRCWEVYGTIPGKMAINGAWLDPAPMPLEN